mmetsp:Transcript_18917/g.48146  ORF Transcript_18917/g.48146 Transcript_18917/m.48146 type:complete len:154 (+) Transcript_18917:2537-2998(+)
MKALQGWLYFAGALRLFAVTQSFTNPSIIAERVYDLQPELVHGMYGRLFGAWTSITVLLCFLCARNIHSRPIYQATLGSFFVALGHFASEYFVFKTCSIAGAGSPFVVASKILWNRSLSQNVRTSILARHFYHLDAGRVPEERGKGIEERHLS